MIRHALLAAVLAMFLPATADAQSSISCESRNFRYQFCPAPDGISQAVLARQTSSSACVEGQSWGWDRRGVWVSGGCAAIFNVNTFRPQPSPPPRPGGDVVGCASRSFQYEFCPTGARVLSASLVRQTSRAPCVVGKSWGWRQDGIWVSEGCTGEFAIQTGFRPDPRPPTGDVMVCESHEYRYNFCRTGPIRNARIVRQISEAPCVQGRSWGLQRDGIWVDNGCEAAFRIITR